MLKQYNRLPKMLDYVETNRPLKEGVSNIGAHRITDIVSRPPSTLVVGYLSGLTLTFVSPIDLRYIWLVLGSTYHFSKDMIDTFPTFAECFVDNYSLLFYNQTTKEKN